MTTRFTLPHIDISAHRSSTEYTGQGGRGNPDPRNRAAHGGRLLAELDIAFTEADRTRPTDERLPQVEGSFIEVELRRGDKGDNLEKKRAGLRPAAVKTGEMQQRIVALFVPDSARPVLEQILADYTNGPLRARPERVERLGHS